MSNKNTKQRSITITERLEQMAKDVGDEKGHTSFSETVRHAIALAYQKEFPAYAKSSGNKPRRTSAKDPAEQKLTAESKGRIICDQLEGEVHEKPDGRKVCKYFTYHNRERYKQEVDLDKLEEEMLDGQYEPSRNRIKTLQEKEDVNYDPSDRSKIE